MTLSRTALFALVLASPANAWEVQSEASGVVEEIDTLRLTNAAYIVRTSDPATNGMISVNGSLEDVIIRKYERIRPLLGPDKYTIAPPTAEWQNETLQAPQGTFAMADHPKSAFGLTADTLSFHNVSALSLRKTVEDPPLSGGNGNTLGLPWLRDEPQTRAHDGRQLLMAAGAVQGAASGVVWIYLFNQTATFVTSDGQHRLSATSWTEGPANLRTHHMVWYEITGRSNGLAVEFQPAEAPSVLLTPHADMLSARRISVASASGETVAGPVPSEASLWLEGILDVRANPAAQDDGFDLHVTGQVQGFSYGGGLVQSIDPSIAVSASAILVALFVAALVARQALSPLAIFLYTKLKKDKLLDVAARDTIYRVIQQAPGIHFVELQKQVGSVTETGNPIGFGALAYHLSQMERFELIVSKREGRFRRYFDVGAKMGADTARIALLQTSPVNLVAHAVLASPGANQGHLHARVNPKYAMTRQALSYHLRRLATKELVAIETRGRFCHYRATEKLERLAPFVVTEPATAAPPVAVPAVPAS